MLVTLKRLRHAGQRKSDRDIGSDPGIRGEFHLVMVGGVAVAKVYDPAANGTMTPLCPELHRAKLMAAHGDLMYFRGFEQGRDGAVEQEWSLRIER